MFVVNELVPVKMDGRYRFEVLLVVVVVVDVDVVGPSVLLNKDDEYFVSNADDDKLLYLSSKELIKELYLSSLNR